MIETLTDLGKERDAIVASTDTLLTHTTILANTVLSPNFPNAWEESVQTRNNSSKRSIYTRFIQLPAQRVNNNSLDQPMIRRVAFKMCFTYFGSERCSDDILSGIRGFAMPKPDEISFVDPQGVALPADTQEGYKLYQGDSTSISGKKMPLLRWVVGGAPRGILAPHHLFSDDPEAKAFPIFRDLPNEALSTDIVEYHRTNLENYMHAISVVTLALQNTELNPHS